MVLLFNERKNMRIEENEDDQKKVKLSTLELVNFGISRTSRNLEEKIKAKSQLP